MSYPSVLYGPESERFNTYSSQRFPMGTELHLQDGRVFRFGENGAVAAVAGHMFQSEVPEANFDTLVVPAATAAAPNTVGSRFIRFTNGATAITANMLAEGFALTEAVAGSGEGYAYKIDVTHDAMPDASSYNMPLAAGNGLQSALTAGADTITLIRHPYRDVIEQPGPPTAAVIGIAAQAIAANYFGWFQVRGLCACFVAGTHVIGGSISPTGSVTGTAGAVEATGVLITTTAPTIAQETEIIRVGICVEVAPTGDFGSVLLNMA